MESSKLPVFFKELPLVLNFQGKPELVAFAAGFSKAVDPLSGMTINLKDIMHWQDEWKERCNQATISSWFEFLLEAQNFLSERASVEKAKVPAIQIRFFDRSLLRYEIGSYVWSCRFPLRDSLNRLRICELSFEVARDSELQYLQDFQFPEALPGSFDELELFVQFFESKTGLPLVRAELQDPETQLSLLFP